MSLANDLATLLTTLAAQNASDNEYKLAFSTATKRKLAKGETWRRRLVLWQEREAAYEREQYETT